MSVKSMPLHNMTRVAADAAITAVAGHRVWRIDLYGTTDAVSLALYDAASATGTPVYVAVAPFTDADASAAETKSISFFDVGGINFPNTGIYADITGTNAVAYVWWD